jgi:redox-sensitive bicupin YhaK (pirin superfamily)
MNVPVKLDHSIKRGHSAGGFGIEILFPGIKLSSGDSGVGAIARIDQARFMPGSIVPMHAHKDDEILTYLRSGQVIHRDTVGNVEEISPNRLMLMNAGHSFQHEEESLPGSEPLQALQIFMRPREANLEPQVQFHDFGATYSHDKWRLIAGPAGAPLVIRADAWIHDARLAAGLSLALPAPPVPDTVRLVYVFAGNVVVAGIALAAGESLLLDGDHYEILAQERSDLVLFTTDLSAPVFKGGMFSGNVLRT